MQKNTKIQKNRKQNGSLEHKFDIKKILEEILKKNYKLEKSKNILMWCDKGTKKNLTKTNNLALKIANEFEKILIENKKNYEFQIGEEKKSGDIADKELIESIKTLKKNDILILIATNKVGQIIMEKEKTKTKELSKKQGFKIISMPSLGGIEKKDYNKFLKAFEETTEQITKKAEIIKKEMKNTKKVKIENNAGTNIEFEITKRKIIINDGIPEHQSTNIPFGEIYTAPIENSANGIIYLEEIRTLQNTKIVKGKIWIKFENGNAIKTNSKELNKTFLEMKKINKNEKSTSIAEFGIGLNEKATYCKSMLNDEKIYGTCHIAIGNNSSFGGKNNFIGHYDQIISKPTIWFDEKKIMEKGKLIIK